jgi:sarcosine oxidase
MYSTIVQLLKRDVNRPITGVDVVVIGGGVVGVAAALAVARRGKRVALLERSSLASAQGSSKGSARIYAPLPYPDESYLEVGLRALDRWRELEGVGGERLLSPTGALSRGAFAERALPVLRDAGVEAALLSCDNAFTRFGVSASDDRPLLHQIDAGIIRADRARRVLIEIARGAGVEFHEHERVRSLADRADSLEVETDRGKWRCSSAIVAAGPWSGELLAGAGLELPLTVSCQSVAYLELRDPRTPPVVLMEFEGEEPFALWDPLRGLKAALHARGPTLVPESGSLDVDAKAIDRAVAWARARFPRRTDGVAGVESCLYTNTPNEQFILERRNRIVVGSACNGQGFQFAPETGERLARLATESPVLSGARPRMRPT